MRVTCVECGEYWQSDDEWAEEQLRDHMKEVHEVELGEKVNG